FFTVERFEACASAREDKAETCAAVVDRDHWRGGGARGHNAPHCSMVVFSDSCSAWLTISQRFHATGSINFLLSRLTQARRSFGSIASSSQHRSPCLATNHRKRGSFRLSVAGNDGSAFTCFCVSAIRLSVT